MNQPPITVDPSAFEQQHGLTATNAACAHLARMLEQAEAAYVRFSVNESGCNGYMYELSYAASAEVDEAAFEVADGLTVLVRHSDLPLIQGTVIDYVTEGLNSALKFRNPNADAHCGCGESFSISAGG